MVGFLLPRAQVNLCLPLRLLQWVEYLPGSGHCDDLWRWQQEVVAGRCWTSGLQQGPDLSQPHQQCLQDSGTQDADGPAGRQQRAWRSECACACVCERTQLCVFSLWPWVVLCHFIRLCEWASVRQTTFVFSHFFTHMAVKLDGAKVIRLANPVQSFFTWSSYWGTSRHPF